MDKFRVLLFGLTGQGNSAFQVLINQPAIQVVGVITRGKLNTPYPYYQCKQLNDVVEKEGVSLFEGLKLKEDNTREQIFKLAPDLIVVSGFDQILPYKIINIPRFGVLNLHPSLLPRYRGAEPIIQALLHGEGETGLTACLIEDELVDKGRIVLQSRLQIDSSDTGGLLRSKLDHLVGSVLPEALQKVVGQKRESFLEQSKTGASYFSKLIPEDWEINLNESSETIINKVRALNPYPLARLNHKGVQYVVREVAKPGVLSPVKNCFPGESEIFIEAREGRLLFLAQEQPLL